MPIERTVFAVVDKRGRIEALLLSRRECDKVIRAGEIVVALERVGWMSLAEWAEFLKLRVEADHAGELAPASQSPKAIPPARGR